MDPITREEKYLNAILSGDTSDLPTPITREEMYLYNIAMNGGGEKDSWTATAQVDSNGIVTFTGLNDAYGYALYAENVLVAVASVTKTGSGSNVTLAYTVSGADVGTVCKLRILK